VSFKLYESGSLPKEVTWFSASQIKLFKSCKVCWALRYLDKVEQAPNAAAQRGVEIHKLLEDYLKEGKPIDPNTKYGKMALSGINYLPLPGTCQVEEKVAFSFEDVYFRGVIDCVYQKQNGLWTVLDHKTTKNFKYALSADALARDLQASLYAYFVANKYSINAVDLNWVYYLTAGAPKAQLVSNVLSLTSAEENVSLILDDCREMLDAKRRELTALDFDPPPHGCQAFGPCAVTILGDQHKGARMSSEKRSLKDLLDRKAVQVEETSPIIEAVVEPAQDASEAPEPALKALDNSSQDSQKGFTLLIDCLPRHGQNRVIELGDLLRPVFKQVSKEYNVSHPGFIPYESTAVYVTMLDKHLTENPPPDGSVVVLSLSSPDARNAVDVLINHAAKVFQGTR
jgi:hypothetical protein